MPTTPAKPPEDPNLAGFRAMLARKKAAKAPGSGPMPAGSKAPDQKPRAKERMRRRP